MSATEYKDPQKTIKHLTVSETKTMIPAEQSRAEQSRAEQSRAEQSRAEQSRNSVSWW